ncbi:MAG: DNA polymerase III subunit gamma/tau [Actinobacteria bacterium]|nr:DNA polymerase III subunit gamma/tau [Actinomycetota bacterium]
MKHTTLYRKWRPRRMGEIVGQEPVVRTLSRAIETGRVAHAYLFSGPRGTGKTSTAKVLAMGLNCEKGPTPEPDGTCESCRAIMNSSSLDVVEMDAASNRGIDEIRDLRDRVNLAPVAGRVKVYIIDEVHMLTPEAFNALLKMLEEPPEHVVFVLATTEKHKVLSTIISRCQGFDFRRPGVETLREKLAEIAQAEGIEVEPEALTVIAREGRGSFRDAEGLLDQLSSFAEGKVTAAMVRELLGSVGPGALLETTAALHERRAADALRILDRLSNEGRDLGQFVGELISHLRNLMLLPHAPEVALAEVGAEERGSLEEQARSVPTAEVVWLIEALGDTMGRIKRGGDPKLELELSFLKLARGYTEPSVESLVRRLETLELAAEQGSVARVPEAAPEENPVAEPASNVESEAVPEAREEEPEETEDNTHERPDLGAQWGALMQDLRDRRQAPAAAVYEEARVEGFDGAVLELAFPEELAIYVKLAQDARHADPLREAIARRFGVSPRIECRVADGTSADTAPTRQDPPRHTALQENAPDVQDVGGESRAEEPESVNESGAGEARGSVSGEAEDDDIIRDQREVFEMARERFDPRDPDGGS